MYIHDENEINYLRDSLCIRALPFFPFIASLQLFHCVCIRPNRYYEQKWIRSSCTRTAHLRCSYDRVSAMQPRSHAAIQTYVNALTTILWMIRVILAICAMCTWAEPYTTVASLKHTVCMPFGCQFIDMRKVRYRRSRKYK